MIKIEINLILEVNVIYIKLIHVAFSANPRASACFLAFSLKSAMLEFLLCAAANAARLSGYCGRENIAEDTLFPVIAAAY